MSSNLPVVTPAEALDISPESLEIANVYLQEGDMHKVAEALDVSLELVTQTLSRREVKAYVDNVFYNIGFNNRFRLRSLMDTIIQKKLKDMDEAETGSTKDITEIIALSHKMTMEQMDKEIQLLKLTQPKTQTQLTNNIQINEGITGTKYGTLIDKLINPDGNTIDV